MKIQEIQEILDSGLSAELKVAALAAYAAECAAQTTSPAVGRRTFVNVLSRGPAAQNIDKAAAHAAALEKAAALVAMCRATPGGRVTYGKAHFECFGTRMCDRGGAICRLFDEVESGASRFIVSKNGTYGRGAPISHYNSED